MRKYKSPTTNGGTTVILPSAMAAVEVGRSACKSLIEKYSAYDPSEKVKITYVDRDKDPLGKGHKPSNSTYGKLVEEYERMARHYEVCCKAIIEGSDAQRKEIMETAERLQDLALQIAPSLAASHLGFITSDQDGIDVSPDLLAAGDPNCLLQRRAVGDTPKEGQGEGAYRFIINTDVSWWGKPTDNAAMVGAMIMLLQQYKPCELWIQQGWLGGDEYASDEHHGVTLFKLDFTGSFDPTQLAFWIGHEGKDQPFSYCVNLGLGRKHTATSTKAEIEADLMFRGDWMRLYGINSEPEFFNLLATEKDDLMAKWIAGTAMQVAFEQKADEGPKITLD